MQAKSMLKIFSGKSKILLSILLTAALFFGAVAVPKTFALAAGTSSQQAIYVALGDSVPAGYGLSDSKKGYVQLFSDAMSESGYSNAPYNYAVSGWTTGNLLAALQGMEAFYPEVFQTIQNASVITLNIGGNNVLGPLITAINEKLADQLKALGISSITEASSQQLFTLAASLYSMTLDDTQLAAIQQGAQDFATDFPKIIEWLKTNAPGASILVSTVYNPLPSFLSFYGTSETLLKGINSLITGSADQSGYYCVDVYSTFLKEQAKGTQVINLNLGQYATSISADIHPNAAGHALIAKAHKAVFQSIPGILNTSSGTPVTAYLYLTGKTDKKGTLSLSITKAAMKAALDKAQSEETRTSRDTDGIALWVCNTDKSAKSVTLAFDSGVLSLLKSANAKEITLHTNILDISLDQKAISKIAGNTSGKVTLKAAQVTKLSKAASSLIGTRPVYALTLKDSGSNTLSNLGKGTMTLSIPYTATSKEKKGTLFAVTIDGKGNPKKLAGSVFSGSYVSITSNQLSTYGIGYSK